MPIALPIQLAQVVSLLLALLVAMVEIAQLTVINELWAKADSIVRHLYKDRIADSAASSPVLKGLYESKRNETKANPVFITQDAKRTNELSPDGRLS
jgi:hypothetical protein